MSQPVAGIPAGQTSARVAYLFEMQDVTLGTYYRFTTARRTITYNGAASPAGTPDLYPAVGAAFTRQSFRVGSIVEDGAGNNAVDIEFDNENGVLTAIAANFRMWKWPVRVWFVTVDTSFAIQSIALRIRGETDGLTADEDKENERTATLGVKRRNTLSRASGPSEDFTIGCRYVGTRDPRCGHPVPGTPCARTVTACDANGRRPFYGGFPEGPTEGTVFYYGGVKGEKFVLPKRDL